MYLNLPKGWQRELEECKMHKKKSPNILLNQQIPQSPVPQPLFSPFSGQVVFFWEKKTSLWTSSLPFLLDKLFSSGRSSRSF